MMGWFSNLFGKKPDAHQPVLSLILDKNPDCECTLTDPEFVIDLKTPVVADFINYIRNHSPSINIAEYSDKEIAHLFVYQYSKDWLIDNLKRPLFIETHNFASDGEIKYERAWNEAFITAVTQLGFEQLPQSEEEIAELYMNYIYGTRLMEEMEATEAAEPVSSAHPELSDPSNRLKKG